MHHNILLYYHAALQYLLISTDKYTEGVAARVMTLSTAGISETSTWAEKHFFGI